MIKICAGNSSASLRENIARIDALTERHGLHNRNQALTLLIEQRRPITQKK
jgi:hypothetical protein